MSPAVTPFTIDVPQSEIDDLRSRLRATRWPDAVADDWSQGTAPGDLRRLVEYWAGEFDWRAVERRLNALDHVLVEVDGARVHAIRAGTPGATPLLLVHGWPDSVLRFEKAIPLLASRFELVIPSVPGYGFSDKPTARSGADVVADRFAGLMTALGHERFGVHGADIGTTISEQLAMRYPQRVIGLHLGDIPMRRLRSLKPEQFTDAERQWFADTEVWDLDEGAYAHQQHSKPQTLAASLNDSPAGLASWILEKFRAWSDCNGDVYSRFSPEELAANLSIYWFTQTAGSAARYYYDARRTKLSEDRVETPTGVANFPRDMLPATRETAERWFNIVRWTDLPSGGHFGPWEEPGPWSAEVVAFFDQLEG